MACAMQVLGMAIEHYTMEPNCARLIKCSMVWNRY